MNRIFYILLITPGAALAFLSLGPLPAFGQSGDVVTPVVETYLDTMDKKAADKDVVLAGLDRYQEVARGAALISAIAIREHPDQIEQEINALMEEFGAETYSIPREFLEQVTRFIQLYQGRDKAHMLHALRESRKDLQAMRTIFKQDRLPPDLAYMVVAESALKNGSRSAAGAAGLWQFTAVTGRAYGLKVGGEVDERLNMRKATKAACKYIRELILDFGSGSSVMLALAAYNVGPTKVKQAVRSVRDPIKQRNFWHLYRVRALPEETLQYVPKVIAAMIIARNPEAFMSLPPDPLANALQSSCASCGTLHPQEPYDRSQAAH